LLYDNRFCLRVDIDAFTLDNPPAGEKRYAWLAAKISVKVEKEVDARKRRAKMRVQEEDEEDKVYDSSSVRISKIRQMEVCLIILKLC
jgi:hypothetical protein